MVDALVATVASVIAEERGVVAAYVFGSVARGTSAPTSDVDVGVLFDTTPPAVLGGEADRLRRRLERALAREVDLVVLNTAPADLVHRVLRDGILAFERDRSVRIAFEIHRRNEYFDLLPVLARYRRSLAS